MTETLTGTDRSAGVSFDELLDADTHPVSEALRSEGRLPRGNTRVPAVAYTSREWHDLEVEKLWGRVWQLACLEEEIPEVGDYHVYDIADRSFLIVRTAPDRIQAFNNACLHRGRQLRTEPGKGAANLRCAFHGWCWNLDGSMKEIPCQWDFPTVDPAEHRLPEAAVGTWHGFVFVNPDRDCEPLADFLEGLDEHHALLPFEQRHKAAHVSKIMPVNWKACQEAFMESYHVVATHPTLMENLGDANTRYDAFKNFSRAISPHGVESPHLANMTRYEQISDGRQFARWRHPMSGHVYERIEHGRVRVTDLDGHDSVFDDDGNWIEGPRTQADPHLCKWVGGPLMPGMEDVPLVTVDPPEGTENLRAWIADARRADVRAQWGDRLDVEQFSDAEMIDAMYYSVFPNWSPWGPFNSIFYRWRPNGNDPDTCIFEVMFFVPWPDDATRPPPAKPHHLGIDDDWTTAAELGPLAKVFQQDSLNLPHVQRGLKAQERQEVVFGSYNETKIRHFWHTMYRWLELDGPSETLVEYP